VLRAQQASERRAVLPFPTLLVQSYSVIARAEDAAGRLLGYGCVDLPEQLLRTGLRPVVPVPLSPVFPSPLGSYALTFKLQSKPATPLSWEQLACGNGLGQVLLDAVIQAVPAADSDLAMRLTALRAAPDASGCRLGSGKPDERLHQLLAATQAGSTLLPVAQDGTLIQKNLQLASQLQVSGAPQLEFSATHTLQSALLATAARSATYSLTSLPVPSASGIALTQRGALLSIAEHSLTLRLPTLWRRALDELSLMPRGISMTPWQLFQNAVTTAQSGARTGCDAVESVLCTGVAPPCAGKLAGPCGTAAPAVAAALAAPFTEPPPGLDLALSFSLTMEDPDGTLQAQTLEAGQAGGRAATAVPVSLAGTVTGARIP
jgi:hypothetical protein